MDHLKWLYGSSSVSMGFVLDQCKHFRFAVFWDDTVLSEQSSHGARATLRTRPLGFVCHAFISPPRKWNAWNECVTNEPQRTSAGRLSQSFKPSKEKSSAIIAIIRKPLSSDRRDIKSSITVIVVAPIAGKWFPYDRYDRCDRWTFFFSAIIWKTQGPRRGRGWGGFSPPTFLQE